MNVRFAIFSSLILLSAASFCSARQRSSSKIKITDSGYVAALSTANRFLNAWQVGDLETGTVLLSDRARRSQSADSLEKFFSRTPDRAFEINHGKCERSGCRFPVVMLSEESGRVHRKFSEIELVNNGKSDWAVDKVP